MTKLLMSHALDVIARFLLWIAWPRAADRLIVRAVALRVEAHLRLKQ